MLRYWHYNNGLDCLPHWSRDQDLDQEEEEEEEEEGEEEKGEPDHGQPEEGGGDSGEALHQRDPNHRSRIDEEGWSTGYSLGSP